MIKLVTEGKIDEHALYQIIHKSRPPRSPTYREDPELKDLYGYYFIYNDFYFDQ
jgi:hypothetical protein